MKKIAFLGLGAMGSRMATKLVNAGHDLTVWNRTPERAKALAVNGLTIADSPREAALGADAVFAMVRDDASSRQVWLDPNNGALSGLGPNAIAIECSTLSLPYVRELAQAFGRADRQFVDAPLAGSRPQAEAGQLLFFVGGSKQSFQHVLAFLEPMAGAVHHAGDTGTGTTIKLMINALFGAQLGVVAELIGFAQKAGIDPHLAVEILSSTPVCSPAAKVAAVAMNAGAWDPAFPIDLVAKDFKLLGHSAQDIAADMPISLRTGQIYAKGAEAGFGDDNITGIVQLYT